MCMYVFGVVRVCVRLDVWYIIVQCFAFTDLGVFDRDDEKRDSNDNEQAKDAAYALQMKKCEYVKITISKRTNYTIHGDLVTSPPTIAQYDKYYSNQAY